MENEGMAGFRIKTRGGGGGGGGGGDCGGTKCGRWNPTTEQVKVLTDLFRSGLRTPSTDQIQKISSQLSYYGKIESKNVFYWFQNHKARERQKRRRVYADEEIEIINREDNHKKVSSTKHFAEINQVMEPERVIETLQLFPQNSFNYGETTDKFMVFANECNKENASFAYSCGTEMDHRQPPLDLRLSFLMVAVYMGGPMFTVLGASAPNTTHLAKPHSSSIFSPAKNKGGSKATAHSR